MTKWYPPRDPSPFHQDPFVHRQPSVGKPSVAEAIEGRFCAGETIADLAMDYVMTEPEIECVLRWAIARAHARKAARRE